MERQWKIALGVLAALLVIGVATFPSLVRNVSWLRRADTTEEQAQRDITREPVRTPNDVQVKAHIYWVSATAYDSLTPSDVELPLAADPVVRAKQLIAALIAPPSEALRTLPADSELLAFYLLPDGSAVADFSDTLATKTASGILSEQLAVNSVVQTLAANVPEVHSLKILIHGQQADTLAGHLDLTGFFAVVPAPVSDQNVLGGPSSSVSAPAASTPTP